MGTDVAGHRETVGAIRAAARALVQGRGYGCMRPLS